MSGAGLVFAALEKSITFKFCQDLVKYKRGDNSCKKAETDEIALEVWSLN